MKRIFILLSVFLSSQANALTKEEWVNFIVDSVETKEDLTWSYDTTKLKTYAKMAKNEDINTLEEIANGDDIQVKNASKYLLALLGEKTNKFLIDNYLEDKDIKNSLYYLNLNFINTPDKKNFWQYLLSKENISKNIVLDSFEECSNFEDVNLLGGQVFEFNSYDDFYNKRDLLSNYTNLDLMHIEFELSDAEYPVSITLFRNKFTVNKESDDLCLKASENVDYVYLQKIGALYKQYQKEDLLKPMCNSLESNMLLKSKFNYLCM